MVRRVIALGLAGYALYTAAYIPAMFIGPPVPLLAICFILQVVFALAAAIGILLDQPWTTVALILLGICIVVTQLVEAFVLGILPWLRALFVSVLALVITIFLAVYLSRREAM